MCHVGNPGEKVGNPKKKACLAGILAPVAISPNKVQASDHSARELGTLTEVSLSCLNLAPTPAAIHYRFRWRILLRIRRFFLPTLRRPLPLRRLAISSPVSPCEFEELVRVDCSHSSPPQL